MASIGKIKLIYLESRDTYLFHGSGIKLEELEPRQSYTVIDGVNTADGPPAVFAASLIDYAIFMSLINEHNCRQSARSRCSYEDGKLIFGATQATLDQLDDNTVGYVHVFSRTQFQLRGGCEWRCFERVKPLEVFAVGLCDFEPHIEIMDG